MSCLQRVISRCRYRVYVVAALAPCVAVFTPWPFSRCFHVLDFLFLFYSLSEILGSFFPFLILFVNFLCLRIGEFANFAAFGSVVPFRILVSARSYH